MLKLHVNDVFVYSKTVNVLFVCVFTVGRQGLTWWTWFWWATWIGWITWICWSAGQLLTLHAT